MTATILQGDNEASVLDISLSEEYLNSGYLIDIAAGNGIHLSGNRNVMKRLILILIAQ